MEGADLTVEELGLEPVRRPTPLNVEASRVGQPIGWPGPESGCGAAPYVQRVASPESG